MARVLVNGSGACGGGGGTYLVAFARELARGGHRGLDWHFLAGETLLPLLRQSVDVVSLPSQGAGRRMIWEQLHVAAPDSGALLGAAGFGPLLRRKRAVLIAHNALHYARHHQSGRRGMRLAIESQVARASARSAVCVLAPSQSMADLVFASTGVRSIASPFGPGLAQRRAATDDDRFVFLHRTHWGPHKGVTTLLRAVGWLAQRAPGRFVVRTGSDPFTSFAARFPSSACDRALVADPIIAAHVEIDTFALGSLDQAELRGDAVVMPSSAESFCFPLAEALCFGLPIVAANHAYAVELCGDAAFLVQPDDAVALGLAMEWLIDGARPPAPTPERLARLDWGRHVDDVCRAVAAE